VCPLAPSPVRKTPYRPNSGANHYKSSILRGVQLYEPMIVTRRTMISAFSCAIRARTSIHTGMAAAATAVIPPSLARGPFVRDGRNRDAPIVRGDQGAGDARALCERLGVDQDLALCGRDGAERKAARNSVKQVTMPAMNAAETSAPVNAS
jgi:hypothetical protein